MNSTRSHLHLDGDIQHDPSADLMEAFLDQPLYRFSFKSNRKATARMIEHFADKVFRVYYGQEDEDEVEPCVLSLTIRFARSPADPLFLSVQRNHYSYIYAANEKAGRALYDECLEFVYPEGRAKALEGSFYMLRFEHGSFSTTRVRNLPEREDDDFLRLCYGEDMPGWIESFSVSTRQKLGGLTILEGPPGTGKTSLLTQLMHRLGETHVFYTLPNSYNSAMASPEMAPFWEGENERHGEKVKVIIMEDAEQLLWKRESDNREAVSGLLNIADGLLGKMLRLHVVCSINSAMNSIDPAILRAGRLLNFRHFGLLSRENAVRLTQARDLPFVPDARLDYPLCDVFNQSVYPLQVAEAPRAGFA